MSRSAVRDLSRLGSDERHRALAPAFSTGAIARSAPPAAAAAPNAAPVGKAGVGSAARQTALVRSVDRPDRATVRPDDVPAQGPAGTLAVVTETKETTSPLGLWQPTGPVNRRLALPPRGRAAQAAEQLARGSARQA